MTGGLKINHPGAVPDLSGLDDATSGLHLQACAVDQRGKCMRYEFWGNGESVARCFAKRTGFASWSRLIEALAAEIAGSVRGRKAWRWLDVGTGDGWTLNETFQALNDVVADCPLVSTVEPHDEAVSIQKRILPLISEGGPVYGRYRDFAELERAGLTYEVITLIHSSYYLAQDGAEFGDVIGRIARYLAKGGVIIGVALPQSSPFFALGELGRYRCGWAEDILGALETLKFQVRVSRQEVKWHTAGLSNHTARRSREIDNVIAFVEGTARLEVDGPRRERFVSKLASFQKCDNGTKYVDWGDRIVTGRKT